MWQIEWRRGKRGGRKKEREGSYHCTMSCPSPSLTLQMQRIVLLAEALRAVRAPVLGVARSGSVSVVGEMLWDEPRRLGVVVWCWA